MPDNAITAATKKLNAARARAKRRKLGKPTLLSDAQIDALTAAEVLMADAPMIGTLWDQAAQGTGLVGLLDATSADV